MWKRHFFVEMKAVKTKSIETEAEAEAVKVKSIEVQAVKQSPAANDASSRILGHILLSEYGNSHLRW